MGTLIKGLGPERVIWGTDAVWTGAPQWQIEGLRRLEIPEDMQKKHGFQPLGPANGEIKNKVFADNGLRIFGYSQQHAEAIKNDRFAQIKAEYEKNGPSPSNLRYGYIRKSA